MDNKEEINMEISKSNNVNCNNCKLNNSKWCNGCEYNYPSVDNFDFYEPIN